MTSRFSPHWVGPAEGVTGYTVAVPNDLWPAAKGFLTSAEIAAAALPDVMGWQTVTFKRVEDAAAFTSLLREHTGRLLCYATQTAPVAAVSNT